MLIILLLAFSNMAAHLRPHSVEVCLSRLYWFSLLGSYLSFCHGLYAQDLAARCWTFWEADSDFVSLYYQKTESQMTSSTVCALPSPVTFPPLSVMKWSQSLLLRDVLKVIYLTHIEYKSKVWTHLLEITLTRHKPEYVSYFRFFKVVVTVNSFHLQVCLSAVKLCNFLPS